jgi:uncharacterized membrane protein YdbT with pleckstrin-like domain
MTDAAPEEVLFEGRPALIPGLGSLVVVVLTVGLALLWLWLQSRRYSYKLTTQRIIVDEGIFSKTLNQIDLYRVNDYTVERPFGQRMMGTGDIVIQAMDKTNPEVRLRALPTDVVALYESLRTATEREKQKRGVRVVDYE